MTPASRRLALGGSWLAAASACASPGIDRTTLTAAPDAGAAPLGCDVGSGDLGRGAAALSVVDRSIVGAPGAYVPDPTLPAREPELQRSQRARRELAWAIAARVLGPVELPGTVGAGGSASLPLWQTWHNEDDLTRIFRRVYPELSPAERTARAHFDAAALDAAWAWNDVAVSDFEEWTQERLDAYRSALDTADDVAGLGGIQRVAYAPGAGRHLLESYPEVLGCRALSDDVLLAAPAFTPGPCASAPSFEPACLTAQFPASAAQVKATWARLGAGVPLPVFDTSAEALAQRLPPAGDGSWGEGNRTIEGESQGQGMYALELPNGNRFGLTGLHIMTKELEHWVWITLWWSDRPDEDFGADRPPDFPAAFSHYKLCGVVAFEERDPDPSGGFDGDAPSLARALAQTHSGAGGPTWCSNPYIELGAGNAATNCIGCHQHAGTRRRSEDILAAATSPGDTRPLAESTFPSDYVFAVRVGDDLGAMFEETEQHYASP